MLNYLFNKDENNSRLNNFFYYEHNQTGVVKLNKGLKNKKKIEKEQVRGRSET